MFFFPFLVYQVEYSLDKSDFWKNDEVSFLFWIKLIVFFLKRMYRTNVLFVQMLFGVYSLGDGVGDDSVFVYSCGVVKKLFFFTFALHMFQWPSTKHKQFLNIYKYTCIYLYICFFFGSVLFCSLKFSSTAQTFPATKSL